MAKDADVEKGSPRWQQGYIADNTLIHELEIVNIDYSGARTTLSQEEVDLVRKLDKWIMIPSNMYLTRTKPSYYISFFMALWAIASGLTALAKDFKGLLLTRFFLGVLEAPYYPGALYLLSIFYTRKEIATRICILYTGNILATAFAGLIAAGIFAGMDGRSGIKGWQWLFILLGITTFLVAFGSTFTLPDDPLNTKWLTLNERELAHRRIVSDTVDQQSQTTIWTGLKEAIKDYRLWIFALMQHLHLAANGFKYFFPTVVQTLGFSRLITLVLTCPPYIIAGFICIFWSISSGRSNERTWHIITAKAVAVVGFAIACGTLNVGARYAGMIIFTTGTYAVNSIILGWVGSTCGQTKEKKSTSLALVNTISNVSFIWTPYLWPSSDKPRYLIAMSSSIGLSIATAAVAWGMRIILVKRNKKIKQANEGVLCYAY
ncbi:MFS transporter [Histoplasma capsulatum var. duboisii H88]|uniref:MFS transporter n=1 Tax=Ajellomyces capsulatus (strain H88) TaxID=544711 RepID=F0UA14_AJEC8|nr:MFS transporter [Histoplasma capsulatum var. duboisii H88]